MKNPRYIITKSQLLNKLRKRVGQKSQVGDSPFSKGGFIGLQWSNKKADFGSTCQKENIKSICEKTHQRKTTATSGSELYAGLQKNCHKTLINKKLQTIWKGLVYAFRWISKKKFVFEYELR